MRTLALVLCLLGVVVLAPEAAPVPSRPPRWRPSGFWSRPTEHRKPIRMKPAGGAVLCGDARRARGPRRRPRPAPRRAAPRRRPDHAVPAAARLLGRRPLHDRYRSARADARRAGQAGAAHCCAPLAPRRARRDQGVAVPIGWLCDVLGLDAEARAAAVRRSQRANGRRHGADDDDVGRIFACCKDAAQS